jgi:hypothetical protein
MRLHIGMFPFRSILIEEPEGTVSAKDFRGVSDYISEAYDLQLNCQKSHNPVGCDF